MKKMIHYQVIGSLFDSDKGLKGMAEFQSKIKTIEWSGNVSRMVNQTLLPERFEYIDIKTGDEIENL